MRKRGRTDLNHAKIVENLRKVGFSVFSMANLGNGAPDICVGAYGNNYLFEIKQEKKKLTKDEHTFHKSWSGQVAIIYNFEDAINKINNYRSE